MTLPLSIEIQGRVANPFIRLSIFGRACKNKRLHCKSVLGPSDRQTQSVNDA